MPYQILEGHACFTTHVVRNHASIFTSTTCMDVLCSSLAFCREERGLKIYGYVIMPDHMHLLTNVVSVSQLEETLTSMRKFTARRIFELLVLQRKAWALDLLNQNEDRTRSERAVLWEPVYLPKDASRADIFAEAGLHSP